MKRASTVLHIVLFGLTMLIYCSVLISPTTLRISGFVSLLIPLFLLINLVVLVFQIFKLSKRALLPALSVLIGYKFLLMTISFSGKQEGEDDFSVMSYNVKWFVETKKGGGFEKAIDWVSADDATIKCFQEFNNRRDIVKRINLDGEYHHVTGGRGNTLAIFSKYPILNSGILLNVDNINNVLFADVLRGRDTIRIYNVHLESMGIDVSQVENAEEVREQYDNVKSKFLKASVQRTEQIQLLLDHIGQSEYPIVISGDFNDTPYSYNHLSLRKKFSSAFEKAGMGFGFTFNGGLPFLRIDHQFFNDRLRAVHYETIKDAYFSDHFPIKAKYSVLE